MGRKLALAGLLLVLPAVLASCGLPYDSQPVSVPGPLPAGLEARPATPPPGITAHHGVPVALYYVVGGELAPFTFALPRPVKPGEVLDALELDGPFSSPPIPSDIPPGSTFQILALVNGVAHIGLDPQYAGLTTAEQALELGQIVYTLLSNTSLGLKAVAFYENSTAVSIIGGNGEFLTGPVNTSFYCSEAVAGCHPPKASRVQR